MYECKNCGADLHFDIKLQKLKCNYCDQTADVYDTVKESDGVQDRCELNLFECPQCGGQLLSDDTSITQYCSFCGGMTILSSRIANEKMPEEIIPFQITKEECHEAYKKHMRKMFYAPKAFRDCEGDQDFRAIYIPYWKFNETPGNSVEFESIKKRGQSMIMRNKAEIEADYDNIIFDASSSFADELGDEIAPFDTKDLKKFTPSYLCGFYADTADVPAETYQEDAKKAADSKTEYYLNAQVKKQFQGYEITEECKKTFYTQSDEGKRIMLPAWFLAYRKGKRVAYATVNGQTGKVEADLPIDILKFGFATLIIAAALFALFNLFFTFKPPVTMGITSILLTVIMKFYSDEMQKVFYRDHKLSDKGFAYKFKDIYEFAKTEEILIKQEEKKASDDWKGVLEVITSVALFAIFIDVPVVFAIIVAIIYYTVTSVGSILPWACAGFATILYVSKGRRYIKRTPSLKGVGNTFAVIAVVISGIITILNPVSDMYYYIGIFATLVAVLVAALDLIHSHNVAATQPLPEFLRNRGGAN